MTQDYYKVEAVSQSLLKKLITRPLDAIEESEQEPSEAFQIGTLVDGLVIDPAFKYGVVSIVPGEKTRKIIKDVFNDERSKGVKDLTHLRELILEYCDKHGYQRAWRVGTRVESIVREDDYYKSLLAGNGFIVSRDVYDKAIAIVDTLKQTKFYNGSLDCVYQKQIMFVKKGLNCKAMLDIFHIDETNKTIIVADLKTTSDHLKDFHKSVDKYRYDIQAAFYVDAVKEYYPDYDVSFEFIVQSTQDIFKPLELPVDEDFLERGRNGSDYAKGYMQLLDEYKWYLEHGFENHINLSQPVKLTCHNGKIAMYR